MIADGASGNRLLQLISGEARAALEPMLEVELRPCEVLQEVGMPRLHAYFPTTAVVSLVSTMQSGESAEIALVGREGLVGLHDILAPADHPIAAVVQVGGRAVRVGTAALRRARRTHPEVGRVVDLYAEAQLVQVAQTAACNRLHSVEARLARWLLALRRRVSGDEVLVPQERIAEMLGVHRPTISAALQKLQQQHAVARRGRRLVIEPGRLATLACECHHVVEGSFERFFARGEMGVLPPPRPAMAGQDTAVSLEAMRAIAGRLLLATVRGQEAREAAEAANREKEEFIATVTHELRTPLEAILGWCAMLASGSVPDVGRGLRVIERSARVQLTLVNDLLDAARISSATLTIRRMPVDLAAIAEGVIETVTPAAAEKGVTVRLAIANDRMPPLSGDPERLQQVVLNVVSNALKFTDAGGDVEVRVGSEDGRGIVIVRDTGRGIPAAMLPHVFERFRQGTPHDATQRGLGLGLTICRALVELHGGTIQIESAGANLGTTCTISLPLVEDSAAHAAARRVTV